MRKVWGGVIAAVVLLGLAAPGFAASNLQVGYLNSQEVFQNYAELEAAYGGLEDVRAPLEAELKEAQEEIRTLQRELETNLLLPEMEKSRIQEEMREKYMALQQLAKDNQQELAEKESAAVQPLMEEYNAVVKKIAAARGFNVIMELNNPAIIYIDPALDITDAVIAEINQSE